MSSPTKFCLSRHHALQLLAVHLHPACTIVVSESSMAHDLSSLLLHHLCLIRVTMTGRSCGNLTEKDFTDVLRLACLYQSDLGL